MAAVHEWRIGALGGGGNGVCEFGEGWRGFGGFRSLVATMATAKNQKRVE